MPYAPGELKAVASKDGKVVQTDVVRTAGLPAKLQLSADRTRIDADGQDLSFVKVEVLDQDGNLCPNADNEIHFDVEGNALAIAAWTMVTPPTMNRFRARTIWRTTAWRWRS